MCRRTLLRMMSRKIEDSINNQNAVAGERDHEEDKKKTMLPLGEEAQLGSKEGTSCSWTRRFSGT